MTLTSGARLGPYEILSQELILSAHSFAETFSVLTEALEGETEPART